jgi:RNA-directed DNA polymerase
MNVALHGLEEAAGVSYYTAGLKAGGVKPGRPVLVRSRNEVTYPPARPIV